MSTTANHSQHLNTQYTDSRLIGLYDLLNAGEADCVFYERLIGTEPLSVVDVGCGTGVLAVRLARLGHRVCGIDPAAAMLQLAQTRDGGALVNWMHGVAPQLPADAQFDVAVMTGHAFQCLLTDEAVQETLQAIRARLSAGGRLLFESRNPGCTPWRRWTRAASGRVLQCVDGERVACYHDVESMTGDLLHFATYYHFHRTGDVLVNHSILRFMTQANIAAHLQTAGFGQITWYGDWSGSAVTTESAELIAEAYCV